MLIALSYYPTLSFAQDTEGPCLGLSIDQIGSDQVLQARHVYGHMFHVPQEQPEILAAFEGRKDWNDPITFLFKDRNAYSACRTAKKRSQHFQKPDKSRTKSFQSNVSDREHVQRIRKWRGMIICYQNPMERLSSCQQCLLMAHFMSTRLCSFNTFAAIWPLMTSVARASENQKSCCKCIAFLLKRWSNIFADTKRFILHVVYTWYWYT